MRVLLALLSFAAATGCAEPGDPPPERLAATAPNRDFTQTALLAVALESSGEVRVQSVVVKAIPWSREGAPYHPDLHAPPSSRVGWRPRTEPLPSEPFDSPLRSPSDSASNTPVPDAEGHHGALVVSHPARAEPFVVSLDWGQPGEGGGDVGDRWREGSAVWRAPWFGEGTRYRVVRVHPGPPAQLAEVAR